MSYGEITGGPAIAVGYQTLRWAVDELVRVLGEDRLKTLKVNSGEHLAAILTTALLGGAPASLDSTGDVDLLFEFSATNLRMPLDVAPGAVGAAFEVKSLPGDLRQWQATLDRDCRRGIDTASRRRTMTWVGANDVLRTVVDPMLSAALDQLTKKTGPGVSKNVFLISHLLDHPVVECVRYLLIGRLLDPLPQNGQFDSVWMFWTPEHVTIWSTQRHEWIDLVIANNLDDPYKPGPLSALQDVEGYFLSKVRHQHVSPFMFSLTAG